MEQTCPQAVRTSVRDQIGFCFVIKITGASLNLM
jgi:hypothetical protein